MGDSPYVYLSEGNLEPASDYLATLTCIKSTHPPPRFRKGLEKQVYKLCLTSPDQEAEAGFMFSGDPQDCLLFDGDNDRIYVGSGLEFG